jgi:hypothetical protein
MNCLLVSISPSIHQFCGTYQRWSNESTHWSVDPKRHKWPCWKRTWCCWCIQSRENWVEGSMQWIA